MSIRGFSSSSENTPCYSNSCETPSLSSLYKAMMNPVCVARSVSIEKALDLINEKLKAQNLKIFGLGEEFSFVKYAVKRIDGADAPEVQWFHLKKDYLKGLEIPGWTMGFPWKTSPNTNVVIELKYEHPSLTVIRHREKPIVGKQDEGSLLASESHKVSIKIERTHGGNQNVVELCAVQPIIKDRVQNS